jgi:hypothetical protein
MSGSAVREYNGTELVNYELSDRGDDFAPGEGIYVDIVGSQKQVGSSPNVFTYTFDEVTKESNYNITKVYGTLTVISRSAKYEISPVAKSETVKYNGKEQEVTELVTDTFKVDGNTYTVSNLTVSGKGTDVGTYTVSVSGAAVVKDSDGEDVSSEFIVTPQSGILTIEKRSVILTSATDSKTYDGKPLTNKKVTVSGDGFAGNDGADYDVTGSRTVVGTSDNTFDYTLKEGTKADNYVITTSTGTLTVTSRDPKYTVILTANSAEYLYDGTEQYVTGFTINGEEGNIFVAENGETYMIFGMEADAEGIDAGSYTVNVTGTPIITDIKGNDVTDQFAVYVVSGIMTIAKRNVIMTSATSSKQYDGSPLINENVDIDGDGFAEDEGAEFDVTGSQLLPGESENTFTYSLDEGTKAENYVFTKANGTLTVTNRETKYQITAKAESKTVEYNGKEHVVDKLETDTFDVDGNTYKVSGLTVLGKGKNTGTYTVVVSGEAEVFDTRGNNVTDQFTVKTENGTLEITKKDARISKAPAAKTKLVYNKKAQRLITSGSVVGGKFLYTLGDASGPTGTFTTSIPKATDAGTYYVYYKVKGDANHEDIEGGKLIVNLAKAPITITAVNKTSTRGQDLKKLTYKVTGDYVKGDKLGITLKTKAKKNVAGKYAITIKWNKNSNYVAKLVKGVYTVKDAITEAEKDKADAAINGDFWLAWDGNTVIAHWGFVDNAEQYEIYAAKCGTNEFTLVATVVASQNELRFSEVNGKKLKDKNCEKAYVVACRKVNGEFEEITRTITGHTAGKENGKYTNIQKVHTLQKAITLKVGNAALIKSDFAVFDNSKTPLDHVPVLRYMSSDKKVATVDEDGVVTAKGKGKCTIYVIANNGFKGKVKVTVK